MSPEWILFDCMETLVDLEPVPKEKDYAAWAFHPTETDGIWNNFDQFLDLFSEANRQLCKCNPGYAEWSALERFHLVCNNTNNLDADRSEILARTLQKSFFSTYCSKCFVRPDIIEVIPELSQRYQLGVVSNFKIQNGIRMILEQQQLLDHFEWVLTSSEFGWRKPHHSIYRQALKLTGTTANNVLFVGDDPVNDVATPLTFGMRALLLDRHQKHEALDHFERIESFYDLKDLLINHE